MPLNPPAAHLVQARSALPTCPPLHRFNPLCSQTPPGAHTMHAPAPAHHPRHVPPVPGGGGRPQARLRNAGVGRHAGDLLLAASSSPQQLFQRRAAPH